MFEERMQAWKTGLIQGSEAYLARPRTPWYQIYGRHGKTGFQRAMKVKTIAKALESPESLYILSGAILMDVGHKQLKLQEDIANAIIDGDSPVEEKLVALRREIDQFGIHSEERVWHDAVDDMQAVRAMLDCREEPYKPEDLHLFDRAEAIRVQELKNLQ